MKITILYLFLFVVTPFVYAVESETASFQTDLINSQIASPPSCEIISNADIEVVKRKYEGIMNVEKDKIEQDAEKLKSEAPDPNNPGAKFGFNFHFRDEQMEIKLDLPTVKMVDQNMSMDLPEVTMRTNSLSWDVPQAYMQRECMQGVPETVVSTGTCNLGPIKYDCPVISIRAGKEICLDLPKTKMVRNEVKLDIPELSMKRQDWIMGIPEIKMETQRIVFNYPALVVDSIEMKSNELAKRGEKLSAQSKETFNGISTAMKSEITLASMNSVNIGFACQRKQLSLQIRNAFDDLNVMQQGADASLQKAVDLKASQDVIDKLSESNMKLLDAKKQLLTQYIKARRDIESKRKEVLLKMNDSLGQNSSEKVAVTN